MSTDVLLLGAGAQARLVADGVVGARELLSATRARLEAMDPALNAVVTTDWERAEAEAAAADAAVAAGRPLGPLHGLPMTVKDTIETAGLRTTSGAPELADHIPARDAPAVARLRAAGAIVYGKSNVPTWAADSQTTNPVFGTTGNPWDTDRTPGGSSGGAAAAVATGLSAVELGSDLGGSIRIPAHFCGIYGLKPTWGIVPTIGHVPPAPGSQSELDIAVLGPLARQAEDLGLVLDTIAGPNAAAGTAWRLVLPPPRQAMLSECRIGLWIDDPICPVDCATGAAMSDLGDRLARAGVSVVDVSRTAPSLAEGLRLSRRLMQHMAGLFMPADELDRIRDHPEPGEWETNVMMPAFALIEAREQRARTQAAWAELFRSVDVVLTPAMPGPANPHDHSADAGARTVEIDGVLRPAGEQFAWLQAIGSMHLPAVVAPLGRSHGLPIGVQVVGPYLEDRTAIAVAGFLTEVTPGFQPPPLASLLRHRLAGQRA